MYLPSLGFCFLCGYGFQRVLEWKDRRFIILAVAMLVILLTFFSAQTRQQCRVWHDSISLWNHQLKYYPYQAIALNNLATALREEDEYKNAEEVYKKVRAIKSEGLLTNFSDETIGNMRKVNFVLGLYKKAIISKPNSIDAYYNLGNLFKDIGKIPDAIHAYKEALKLDHKYKDAHFSLGELYRRVGDHKQAVYAYNQTILLNPDDEDVYVGIISEYNEVLTEDPKNALYQEARKKSNGRLHRLD